MAWLQFYYFVITPCVPLTLVRGDASPPAVLHSLQYGRALPCQQEVSF